MSFEHNRQGFSPTAQQAFSFDESPHLLRKPTQRPLARLRGLASVESHGYYRKREAVKFGAVDAGDLSSDDEEDPLATPPPPARRASTRSSSATLTNGSDEGSRRIFLEKEGTRVAAAKRAALKGNDASAPEYSDYEEDAINSQTQTADRRDSASWKPQFLVRNGSNTTNTTAPIAVVPMTPSLIRAVDRIEAAKAQAYGSPTPVDAPPDTPDAHTSEIVSGRKQRWEAFWRDVASKAGEKNTR